MPRIYAGVTFPDLTKLNPGDKGNFDFRVDATLFDEPLECVIDTLSKNTSLEVSFETNKIELQPKERKYVSGIVKVPRNTEYGFYKETFCVTCERKQEISGTTTRPRYCGIPINVEVGNYFKKSNYEFPEWIKSKIFFFILINIVLISTIIFIVIKKKKKV